MNVSVIPARQIDNAFAGRWTELQQSNLALVSPYFCPEFTQAVAAVREDVEVALIKEGEQIVAFFPYQRGPRGVAAPVGGIFSDFQGLVCAPGWECDPLEMLRACQLIAWDFDHLIASQGFFASFHRHVEVSPQMDLSGGYEVYATERRAAGSEQIKKCGNLMRRIEREVGPLRFVAQAADVAALQQTLAWKSQQYLAGGQPDLFALGWTRGPVGGLHAMRGA